MFVIDCSGFDFNFGMWRAGMKHIAIVTKPLPAEWVLKPVRRSVRFNRGDLNATIKAAARLSKDADTPMYIIATNYGYAIQSDQKMTEIAWQFYEVNGTERTVTLHRDIYT